MKIKNYPNYNIEINPIRIFNLKTNKSLKCTINSSGYLRINLVNENGRKSFLLHRLIAEAFIPNPNNFEIINHIDGNKLNNIISNLEWCTYETNNNHALDNKLRIMPKDNECSWTKIDKTKYNEIKEMRKTHSVAELTKIYGVCKTTINCILRYKADF